MRVSNEVSTSMDFGVHSVHSELVNLSQIICYFFTNLSSMSPLQNMATAVARKPGLIFCLFLASVFFGSDQDELA